MPSQHDIRQKITDQIVAALKDGSLPPWRRPWRSDPNAGHPCNAVSRRPYRGVNPLVLDIAAHRHGLLSRYWATFRQWQQMGGQVRRRPADVPPGQWGTTIVFCRPVTRSGRNHNGEEVEDRFFVLRTYTVFNADQVEGQFDHLRVGHAPLPAHEIQQRYEAADQAIQATAADICYGGDRACYNPAGDFIQMPHQQQFDLPEFYETLFHELTHWSEYPTRLDWDRSRPDNTYALGELIAELGGVYMAGELGLPTGKNLSNHAAYLQHWLSAMQNDSRFIFRAAAQANRAVDFLLSFSRQTQAADEHEEALAN